MDGLTIEGLSTEDATNILKGLAELPFKDVAQLYFRIQGSISMQMKPKAMTPEEAAAAMEGGAGVQSNKGGRGKGKGEQANE